MKRLENIALISSAKEMFQMQEARRGNQPVCDYVLFYFVPR